MMPTYCNKGLKRYYYYLCYQDTKRAVSECPVHQMVEKAVVWQDRLEIEMKTAGIKSLMEVIENE